MMGLIHQTNISCLSLIFKLSYLKMTILHTQNWFKIEKCIKSYTIVFSRSTPKVAVSRQTWLKFKQGAKILFCHLAILCGTEPGSALTQALYITAHWLSISFPPSWIWSVWITHWQDFNSWHEHPTALYNFSFFLNLISGDHTLSGTDQIQERKL